MRTKIIFIVIMTALILAVSAAAEVVYFNNNYSEIELRDGTILGVRTDVTSISRLENNIIYVKCTPSLKKFKNLEYLSLSADEETNFEYLSEMNKLQCLRINYSDGYCGRLETLPELPNLNELVLIGNKENIFKLSAEEKYNIDGVNALFFWDFKSVDYDSLKYFKNLRHIELNFLQNYLTNEEIDELTEKGIRVGWVKLD